jgi:hypothetical protein
VSSSRTAWHTVFFHLLAERCPRWIELRAEVSLGDEPLRVDGVLALRALAERVPSSPSGLDRLWDHVDTLALLEFKSRGRHFRRGDLHRLFAYGSLWSAIHGHGPAQLTLVLAVPDVNEALEREIGEAGLRLGDESHGYCEMVSDNYFCRSATTTSAGSSGRGLPGDDARREVRRWCPTGRSRC